MSLWTVVKGIHPSQCPSGRGARDTLPEMTSTKSSLSPAPLSPLSPPERKSCPSAMSHFGGVVIIGRCIQSATLLGRRRLRGQSAATRRNNPPSSGPSSVSMRLAAWCIESSASKQVHTCSFHRLCCMLYVVGEIVAGMQRGCKGDASGE